MLVRDIFEHRTNDFWVKDIALSQEGHRMMKIAERDMPGIAEVLHLYEGQKPLAGARITGCITVTKETGVLVKALVQLGAEVRWCSDNQYAINDEVSAALAAIGLPVFGVRGETLEQYHWSMFQALQFQDAEGNFIGPTQIIDDGCDITRYIIENHPEIIPMLKGITEQTTCGIQEVRKLYRDGVLPTALINVNDTFIKKYFDNYYGIKESFIVALHNALSVQIASKNVVVYGYGPVGKGCIDAARGVGAKVYLVEVDILKAVQAHMDGVQVLSPEEALVTGEIFITATGCIDVIIKEQMLQMKDGAVLCNVGHGTREYDVKSLNEDPDIESIELNSHVTQFLLPNGKSLYSLCNGALLNMIASGGNPPFIMNLTFTGHILTQIELHQNPLQFENHHIYELPTTSSEEVAKVSFPELRRKLYVLNDKQRDYLGV